MLKTAGDVIGDWADRAPGWGILAFMLLGGLFWATLMSTFMGLI